MTVNECSAITKTGSLLQKGLLLVLELGGANEAILSYTTQSGWKCMTMAIHAVVGLGLTGKQSTELYVLAKDTECDFLTDNPKVAYVFGACWCWHWAAELLQCEVRALPFAIRRQRSARCSWLDLRLISESGHQVLNCIFAWWNHINSHNLFLRFVMTTLRHVTDQTNGRGTGRAVRIELLTARVPCPVGHRVLEYSTDIGNSC